MTINCSISGKKSKFISATGSGGVSTYLGLEFSSSRLNFIQGDKKDKKLLCQTNQMATNYLANYWLVEGVSPVADLRKRALSAAYGGAFKWVKFPFW